jgi:hypothetical protein
MVANERAGSLLPPPIEKALGIDLLPNGAIPCTTKIGHDVFDRLLAREGRLKEIDLSCPFNHWRRAAEAKATIIGQAGLFHDSHKAPQKRCSCFCGQPITHTYDLGVESPNRLHKVLHRGCSASKVRFQALFLGQTQKTVNPGYVDAFSQSTRKDQSHLTPSLTKGTTLSQLLGTSLGYSLKGTSAARDQKTRLLSRGRV